MSLNWLPKVGTIREKDYADYFARAGFVQTGRTPDADPSKLLTSTGLKVYVPYVQGSVIMVDGYAVTPATNDDLAVTLPANSTSYVYLVRTVEGNGLTTLSMGLAAYDTPLLIPHSRLLARVTTDATSVTNTTYMCDTRKPFATTYPSVPYSGYQNSNARTASWLGGTTVMGTTPTKIWRFTTEYAGVLSVTFRLSRQGTGTAYAKIYAASTGTTPQISASTINYIDIENQPVTVTACDDVEMEIYASAAGVGAVASLIGISWVEATPYAPSLLIE